MSPILLRRYRADRLLREEFVALRERVIGAVDGRLRAAGAALDRSDLEAAYAQAWQGLHAAVLDGQQIVNPAGWLAVVAHRRAVDEHRARRRVQPVAGVGERVGDDRDLAAELDDRAKLRSVLEALRARLSERERKAATLCYLQGLSRAEAAVRLGLSESRMRKLMDGAGAGLRGVAGKVGVLVQAIAGGEWCEQQGSLMRALAFGILDPQGDRYRLALSHSDACPACRAYILSLRGLAVALPPVPALLHPLLAAGAGGAASAGALAGPGSAGAGAGATSAPLGAGAGALSASGAAGAGAAGGGWWLAGGIGAKLAAGCLLALGVGAGCVAFEGHGRGGAKAAHGHMGGARASAHERAAGSGGPVGLAAGGAAAATPVDRAAAAPVAHSRAVAASARASREFGPERPSSGSSAASSQKAPQVSAGAVASAASARSSSGALVPATPADAGATPAASSSPSQSAAAREFAPG